MVSFDTGRPSVFSRGDLTLAHGVRLHYLHQGPKAGPAIVLLHGFSDSSFSFSRVMPLLPAELRVVAPDLRGHGNSERPLVGYRMTDMAQDVVQLMDALGVPSAIVVGHSMGSFVAQAMADRSPKRVSQLVLLASAAKADNAGLRELRTVVEGLSDPVDAEFVRAFQYSCIAKDVPDSFMEAAIANSRRMPASVWKQVINGLVEYRPVTPRPLVPTLVLGGDRDAVFSVAEQMELAADYPNSTLRLMEGIGHTLHWEDPDRFVTELLKFAK